MPGQGRSGLRKPLQTNQELIQRLERYSAFNPINGCREWQRGVNGDGYGTTSLRANKKWTCVGVHRLAWQLLVGPIPEGAFVLHKCNNPRCLNTEHLKLGDCLENAKDREEAGRTSRGEKHWYSKLTEAKVKEIRKLGKRGIYQRDIAKMFGIGKTTVAHILQGHNWRHVS